MIALVSMLHEPGSGSAARGCWGRPVLHSTLSRLGQCERLDGLVLLCREDQHEAAVAATGELATVVPVGVSPDDPELRAVANAQRWADGWRGGLLATTPTDAGWHAEAALSVAAATDAALLVAAPASFALIDPALVDRLVSHATEQADAERPEPVFFLPTPPGLSGLAVTRAHVEQLAAAPPRQRHPGRVLHYLPDAPRLDPVGLAACPGGLPTSVTQSLADFRLDAARSVTWAELTLGDDAAACDAVELCSRAIEASVPPRDATVRFKSTATGRPLWLGEPVGDRLPGETLSRLAANADDGRLSLHALGISAGDARLHETIRASVAAGVSVHVETDLLDADAAALHSLATGGAAIVSVHLPAMTSATYAAVMGVNAMATVLKNLLALHALSVRVGGPIVVPTFVKTRHNVGEMEAWYDHWLRTCGAAVIRGPDFFDNSPATPDLSPAPLLRTDRHPLDAVTERPLAA